MVAFNVPLFFSCIAWELLMPKGTLPKLALLGVAVRMPSGGAKLVPVISQYTVPFVASVSNSIDPPNCPGDLGAKMIVTAKRFPGARVYGSTSAVAVNAFPDTDSLLNITLAVPVFAIINEIAAALPTVRLPNLAIDGLITRVPLGGAALAVLGFVPPTNKVALKTVAQIAPR
jgi:hypothetical protein